LIQEVLQSAEAQFATLRDASLRQLSFSYPPVNVPSCPHSERGNPFVGLAVATAPVLFRSH
jgi:hypothetical protein